MAAAPHRIAVAINPQASFGARSDVGPRVVSALEKAGYSVSAFREPDLDSLRSVVRTAIDGGEVDALVVVGGDGMVSFGANLLAETSTPLGIVPTGTGNDMARGLELPFKDPDAAIASLLAALNRGPRTIDLGKATRDGTVTWFASALSAGFDAVVNDRANRMSWPRGASRYTLAILRELLTFKPISYAMTVDGADSSPKAMLISVANNGSIGGGMRIVPDCELDDGELDLFVVGPLGRFAFLRVLPKVFSGTHTSLPFVSITRAKRVSLNASGIVAYADGERVGPLPVEVEVVPGALRVLA